MRILFYILKCSGKIEIDLFSKTVSTELFMLLLTKDI